MQLKEGPMSYRELSMWFGLKPDTITSGTKSAREKKLQKLSLFCDYHLEGKKIIVDRVMIPEYTKALDVFEEKFSEEWGYVVDPETHKMSWQHKARVDTCARVAKAIQRKYPEARQVAERTAATYTNKIRTNKYGPTYKDVPGTDGYCQMVYLNQDRSGLLTAEQMEIMKQCRKEAYKEIDEQRFKVDEAFHSGEISKSEWKEIMGEIDTSEAYCTMQELLYERLGFVPEKRTQLLDNAF